MNAPQILLDYLDHNLNKVRYLYKSYWGILVRTHYLLHYFSIFSPLCRTRRKEEAEAINCLNPGNHKTVLFRNNVLLFCYIGSQMQPLTFYVLCPGAPDARVGTSRMAGK